MPVETRWDNPDKTIYLVETKGYWEWHEFKRAVTAAYAEIKHMKHDVDVIIWFGFHLPLGDARHNLTIAGDQPDNVKRTVFVNEVGGMLENMIRKVDKEKDWQGPDFVNTLEEARAL